MQGLRNRERQARNWGGGVKLQKTCLLSGHWVGWVGENLSTLLDPGYASIKSLHFKKHNRKKRKEGRKRHMGIPVTEMYSQRSGSSHPQIIKPPWEGEEGWSWGGWSKVDFSLIRNVFMF